MRNALLWTLQILTAGVLGYAAAPKLMGAADSVALFASIGMEPTGRVLTGVLELSAAVMLLSPTAACYGALLAAGVMSGAVMGHLTTLGIEGPRRMMFLMALGVLAANLAIIYLRRREIPVIRHMFVDED